MQYYDKFSNIWDQIAEMYDSLLEIEDFLKSNHFVGDGYKVSTYCASQVLRAEDALEHFNNALGVWLDENYDENDM